jgi:hypothetical protein
MHKVTPCLYTHSDPFYELLSARVEPRTSRSSLIKFCTCCRLRSIRRLQTWLRLDLKSFSLTTKGESMSLSETVIARAWTQVSGKKWRRCSWEMLPEWGEIECGPAARGYSECVSLICPLPDPPFLCSVVKSVVTAWGIFGGNTNFRGRPLFSKCSLCGRD